MADLAQLSIDWDFFVRMVIPWQDSITETDEFRLHRWKERAVPSQLLPPPRTWWQEFARGRYILGSCAVYVADSHRYAERVLAQSGDGISRLIHVDAHHDLGYDDFKQVDCGNWLRFVMERRTAVQLRIVYPDWKGLADLQRRDRPWCVEPALSKRIVVGCWSTEQMFFAHEHVAKIFVCRSSAFTHPRHDRAFCAFVEAICASTGTKALTPFVEDEGINPLEPRL